MVNTKVLKTFAERFEGSSPSPTTKFKYSDDLITRLVSESKSIAEVLRKLNPERSISGGMHAHIKKRIRKLGLDCSHFLSSTQHLISNSYRTPKLGSDSILVKDRLPQRKENSARLRKAMIEYGIEERCGISGCDVGVEWLGKPIRLHIEHKNGNSTDNQPENLCFLCPNCHSQTSTYAVMISKR